ncbi:MAG: DUF262 domain-containing protein [Oscillospiraceae bacterium]|nr:DUF262 domain-containing protein [Oscillospiraceae bacterium]
MPTELKRNMDKSEVAITQYDISVIPNDFNINTIYNLIKSGGIEMPNFQRNYIWDQKRASKLIESLILGLPIPQVFLYQKQRNKFLVIDGQQRLLSIFYFISQRFPDKNKRVALRRIFDENGVIPQDVLDDDEYFHDFKLQLSYPDANIPHPLNGKKYNTLGEYKAAFEFMTIRCMAIRQNTPTDDDSSIFEIFSRLNTGGVNLASQEIRACLYYSEFFRMLNRINMIPQWRVLYGKSEEDNKAKDIEVLLRAFAFLCNYKKYNGSMNTFLNNFAKESTQFDEEKVYYFENLFKSFLNAIKDIPTSILQTKTKKFNTALFDVLFIVSADRSYQTNALDLVVIDTHKVEFLKVDPDFEEAITHSTSHTKSVNTRIKKAKEILLS